MANISAYNIAIASQSAGKISSNPGSVKPDAGGAASFLEMLRSQSQLQQQLPAGIKTNAEISAQIQGETGITDAAGTEPADISRLFEMFGVPQDIAQQIQDYFMPVSTGGYDMQANNLPAKAITRMQAGEFIAETAQDARIPEDIKQVLLRSMLLPEKLCGKVKH
jgi:hypothetical protein